MSEGAFCITCGAETPLTSDRLCEKCFRKRNHLSTIPERIQQYRCPKCNKYEIGGRWSEIDNENLADLRIRENLKIYPLTTLYLLLNHLQLLKHIYKLYELIEN